MPLEAVVHLSDLNQTNPPGTDGLSQADDHIRNIKLALRTDLPNINGVVNCSPAQLNLLNSIAALTVLANATNGAAQPTAIAAGADGNIFKRSGAALAFGTIDLGNVGSIATPFVQAVNSATLNLNGTGFVNIPGLVNLPLANAGVYSFEMYVRALCAAGATSGLKLNATFNNANQEDTAFYDYATDIPGAANILTTVSGGIDYTGAGGGEKIFVRAMGGFLSAASAGNLVSFNAAQHAASPSASIIRAWVRMVRLA